MSARSNRDKLQGLEKLWLKQWIPHRAQNARRTVADHDMLLSRRCHQHLHDHVGHEAALDTPFAECNRIHQLNNPGALHHIGAIRNDAGQHEIDLRDTLLLPLQCGHARLEQPGQPLREAGDVLVFALWQLAAQQHLTRERRLRHRR
jgi:hypothetical protein